MYSDSPLTIPCTVLYEILNPVLRNARNWIYVREYSNGAPTFPLFIFFISLVDDLRKPISIRIRPRSIDDSLYSCQQRMQILLGYYILDTSYPTSFLGQNRICYSRLNSSFF